MSPPYQLPPDAPNYRRQRRRRMLRGLLLAVASGGLLPLLVAWRVVAVARHASSRAPDSRYLLIPGYRLDRGEVPPAYGLRLQRAWQLWRHAPDRVLLLSGCPAHPDAPSEALGGYGFLCDLGLPGSARVLVEPLARDSEENLLCTAMLLAAELDSAGAGRHSVGRAPVAVVSNRWHLARCAWLLQRHGLKWRICAAEARWRPGLGSWLAIGYEALSLLSLAGTDALRLDPKRLLRVHR